ncbi:MAG TPA: hypothetical protein PKI03_16995 [Pseudomonadota bacterium]|nr:hypothetical protein [Pseudomonadota bacterium]
MAEEPQIPSQAPAAPEAPGAESRPSLSARLQRARSSLGFYGLFCVAVLFLQLLIELRGWGFSPGERVHVPPSVRQSPGGYRSYHFWHRGVHGGK